MIAFENPAAFFALLLLPVLYFFRAVSIFKPLTLPLTLSDWHGSRFKWNNFFGNFATNISLLLVIVAFVFTVVALADPVVHSEKKVYSSRGADILFVIDTSPSMAARDIAETTRLEAAKMAIEKIVRENSGESVGIVEMAKEAALVVPPTMKKEVFFEKLKTIVPGELGDGTAIGTGISSAVFHLESSGAPKKCIVLLTDGENNSGAIHPFTAARLARSKNISLYVLGLGTTGAVPLEYTDPKTKRVYSGFLDSHYDAKSLSAIANEGGGNFFGVENLSALIQVLDNIAKDEAVVQSYQIHNVDTKYYDKFLMAAALMIAAAFFIRRICMQEVL